MAEEKGMSQRQLFLRSGVDIRTVRKIVRNPYTVITVETLARLARVLEVDISELIETVSEEQYQAEYAVIQAEEEKRETKKKKKLTEENDHEVS
jgi:transcriptional regulator with XRE-family HTH domain